MEGLPSIVISGPGDSESCRLLALDKETHIPGECLSQAGHLSGKLCLCPYCTDTGTKLKTVRSISEWFVRHLEHHFTQVHFRLAPTGSLVLDTQVLRNDIFEYVILFQQTNKGCEKDVEIFTKFEVLMERLQSMGDTVIGRTPITGVYSLGNAWCLEIPSGVTRDVIRISLTLCMEHAQLKARTIYGYWKDSAVFAPLYERMDDNMVYTYRPPGNYVGTNCLVQREIFRHFEGISRNILVVFRLVRVLCRLFLPETILAHPHATKRYYCQEYPADDVIQASLWREVENFPSGSHWGDESIADHVIGVLKDLRRHLMADTMDVDEYKTFTHVIKILEDQAEPKIHDDFLFRDPLKGNIALVKVNRYRKVKSKPEMLDLLESREWDAKFCYLRHSIKTFISPIGKPHYCRLLHHAQEYLTTLAGGQREGGDAGRTGLRRHASAVTLATVTDTSFSNIPRSVGVPLLLGKWQAGSDEAGSRSHGLERGERAGPRSHSYADLLGFFTSSTPDTQEDDT